MKAFPTRPGSARMTPDNTAHMRVEEPASEILLILFKLFLNLKLDKTILNTHSIKVMPPRTTEVNQPLCLSHIARR